MARQHSRKKKQDQEELNVTTFLNLMVVLIPFLLATAVFSQITIQELNLPTQASGGATPDTPLVTIEVMVRKTGLEIGDGKRINTTIPIKESAAEGEPELAANGEIKSRYDLEKLSQELLNLKDQHPDKEDVTVLLEPDIEYNEMIAVMDAVKFIKVTVPGEEEPQPIVLFPEISIGDAP